MKPIVGPRSPLVALGVAFSRFRIVPRHWKSRRELNFLASDRDAVRNRRRLSRLLLAAVIIAAAGEQGSASVTTTTTLTVAAAGSGVTSVAFGTTVKLTATVMSAGTLVTRGSVIFCDTNVDTTCGGLAIVGAAQLTTSGTASFALRLGVGSHSLKAIFSGTNADPGSASATNSLAVTGTYGSAATISAVPESVPGVYDLTTTVFGYSPLTLPDPTGTADFLDASNANAQLASVPLSSGTASQSLGFLSSAKPSVAGLMASATTVGDFNGDGKPDFAVSDATNHAVQIFLGNGDGTFKTEASYAVGMGAYSLDSSDLNNDGKLDLIVVNKKDSTVSVLLGNGDGTFQGQTSYAIASMPSQVAVGDFNGDGNLDLVGAVASGISILFGNGDGTFQPEVTYPIEDVDYYELGALVPVDPKSLAVGDFNGDGKLDLATANSGIYEETYYDATVSILLGNGDGTFQAAQFYTTGDESTSVAIGDFNGDGKLDLAVTVGASDVLDELNGVVSILIGIGDGTFQPPVPYVLTGYFPDSIHVSDFNRDGNADLAVSNAIDDFGTQDLAYVLMGNGDGTFQPPKGFNPSSTANGADVSPDLAVGDFNGDGQAGPGRSGADLSRGEHTADRDIEHRALGHRNCHRSRDTSR